MDSFRRFLGNCPFSENFYTTKLGAKACIYVILFFMSYLILRESKPQKYLDETRNYFSMRQNIKSLSLSFSLAVEKQVFILS